MNTLFKNLFTKSLFLLLIVKNLVIFNAERVEILMSNVTTQQVNNKLKIFE